MSELVGSQVSAEERNERRCCISILDLEFLLKGRRFGTAAEADINGTRLDGVRERRFMDIRQLVDRPSHSFGGCLLCYQDNLRGHHALAYGSLFRR